MKKSYKIIIVNEIANWFISLIKLIVKYKNKINLKIAKYYKICNLIRKLIN